MEDLSTIARPYAQAVLAQAQAEKQLGEWSDMLAFLAAAVRDPTLSGIVANPSVDADRLTKLLLQIGDGRLSPSGANLVRVLVENRRVDALPQIAKRYEAARSELEGRRQVQVISAYKMTAAQQKNLAKAVSARLGKEVELEASIDKSLIGGVIIRAGDTVIDASMRGRLALLGASMGA
jgi:F-type H+-transporting ATPase subunit delta